jgi:aryl-alcohol dehydrogenase-like predicted oxidoreductase
MPRWTAGRPPSEEVLGRLVKEFVSRDSLVLVTEVHFPMRQGPNGGGLSRKALMTEIDASLRRLGTGLPPLKWSSLRYGSDTTSR